jgi:hypothetical protein
VQIISFALPTKPTLTATSQQRNWQVQCNCNFRETSSIPSRQLVSRLTGTPQGNLCLISCSCHLKWVCSSDLLRDCNS